MISIFRKNDVVNIFLLLPYAILLRLYSLLHPKSYELTSLDTVTAEAVFHLIPSPLVQSVIAILLVFTQAIIINFLANNHRIHRLPSALAGMFYILLASCIPEFQQLSPALIGITFLLIAINNVFKTYNMNVAAKSIFNAAIASAAAAVFYMPYVFAIIAMFIGLTIIRNFRLLERFQFIFGYGSLIWIVGATLFFFNLLDWSFLDQFGFPGSITEFSFKSKDTLWSIGISFLLILIGLLNYYNFMKKKGIDIRKKIDFFYWLLLISLLSIMLFRGVGYQHYYFIMVSLSLFISMGVLLIRNHALAELLNFFILVGVFYNLFA